MKKSFPLQRIVGLIPLFIITILLLFGQSSVQAQVCTGGCNYKAGDPVTFSISGNNTGAGFTTNYVLVNAGTNKIDYFVNNLPFPSVAAGDYIGYSVNYDNTGTAPTLVVGTDISSIGGTCVKLSNSLSIGVCSPNTTTTTISATASGFNNTGGFTQVYVLTNAAGIILQSSATPTFSGLSIGSLYNIYAVNYASTPIPTLTPGTNITAIGGSCVSVSCPVGYLLGCPIINPPSLTVGTVTVCSPTTVDLTTLTTTILPAGQVYEWHNANDTTPGSLVGSPTNISVSGTYYVFIKDTATGCYSTSGAAVAITINATPAAPTSLTATPNPVCLGQSLTLTAIGSNLSWTGQGLNATTGSPVTATPTAAGTVIYSVTQTLLGCTSTAATISVTVNATPIISSVIPTNPTTCAGTDGTITLLGLTPTTSYSVSYVKNGGSPVVANILTDGLGQLLISNLGAGIYTAINVSLSGCSSANQTATLTDPTPPAAPTSLTATPNPVCLGQSLTLTAIGSNLSWTGQGLNATTGSPVTATPTAAGTVIYSVTQTLLGCTSTAATISVTVNATPIISSVIPTNPTTCAGTDGTITLLGLTPTTSYSVSYVKNGGSPVVANILTDGLGQLLIPNLGAGIYTAINVTLNGCSSANQTATLTDPTPPAAPTSLTATPNPVCLGQSLTLTAIGSNLSWTGQGLNATTGSPVTATPTAAGTVIYSVTQTLLGCTSTAATISVTVNATPIISSVIPTNPTTCAGTNGTITLLGLTPTTSYSVSYLKNGGSPVVANILTDGLGQLLITNLGAGIYTAINVSLSGCSSANQTATLTDPTPPAAPTSLTATPNPVCLGQSLTLTAIGSNLSWTGQGLNATTGSPVTATPTAAGTVIYSVTQTLLGCTSTAATISVTVNATPIISSVIPTNPTTCAGTDGTITLLGLTPTTSYSVSYVKNGGNPVVANILTDGLGQLLISNLGAGIYTAINVTLSGCSSANQTATLTDPTPPVAPTVTANSSTNLCPITTVDLTALVVVVPGITYEWYTANNTSSTLVATPSSISVSGTYYVFAKSTLTGCYSTTGTAVTVTITNPCPLADAAIQIGVIPPLTVGIQSNIPITVSSVGTAPVTGNLVFTTTLPASVAAPAAFSNNGWSCTTTGQNVACSNPNVVGLPALIGTSTFNIPVTPLVGSQGQTPSFTVNLQQVTGETNLANNTDTKAASVPIVLGIDLIIANAGPATGNVNQNYNYTLTVTNDGTLPTDGSTITIQETLPSGLTFVQGLGIGWNCSAVLQVVTCTSTNVINSGVLNSQQISLTVTPTLAGTYNTFANINGGGAPSLAISNTVQTIIGQAFVLLSPKALLQGSLAGSLTPGLMRDDLRSSGLIPLSQPYGSIDYTDISYAGTETTTSGVLAITGNNAIVDWVMVELRDKITPTIIISRQAALMQRDGDIVSVDGVSPLTFTGVSGDNYYVVIRHRNHLGIMTAASIALSSTGTSVDFTNPLTAVYSRSDGQGNLNPQKLMTGFMAMWAGNAKMDNFVKAQGTSADKDDIATLIWTDAGNPTQSNSYFVTKYARTDIDMNGYTKMQGSANDIDFLYSIIWYHPDNPTISNSFFFYQQLP